MSDEVPTPEESMSEETGNQSALRILQGQVESLTSQLQTLTSERDEYRDALSEVVSERDTLKTEPDAASRIAELEASIRDRNHFDKFAELAQASKAKAKALRQLWRDAKDRGYEASGDEPDEKALHAAVARLKTEVDYAFDPEPENATAAREAARPTSRTKYGLEMRGEAPAGGGRGDRTDGKGGTVSAQMRADPKFMLDPKNRQYISDAAANGRFTD